jgi:hypothetical protein
VLFQYDHFLELVYQLQDLSHVLLVLLLFLLLLFPAMLRFLLLFPAMLRFLLLFLLAFLLYLPLRLVLVLSSKAKFHQFVGQH